MSSIVVSATTPGGTSTASFTVAASAWPDATNTGPAAGGYTVSGTYSGGTITAPNTVITGKTIPNGTRIATSATGVVLRGCKILGDLQVWGNNAQILYCEVAGGSQGIQSNAGPDGNTLTVDHCNLHGQPDDPFHLTIGAYILTNNWVHDLLAPSGHLDIFSTWDGPCNGTRVHHNTFSYTRGSASTSAVIGFAQDGDTHPAYFDVQITDNWFAANMTAAMYSPAGSGGAVKVPSNIVVTGNVFVSSLTNNVWQPNPWGSQPAWGANGNVWADNHWDSLTGALIAAP